MDKVKVNEGSAPGQKTNNPLWNEVGEKSESHQREEILELLWIMREKGPVRVEEFLQMTEKEGMHLMGKMEQDAWISLTWPSQNQKVENVRNR